VRGVVSASRDAGAGPSSGRPRLRRSEAAPVAHVKQTVLQPPRLGQTAFGTGRGTVPPGSQRATMSEPRKGTGRRRRVPTCRSRHGVRRGRLTLCTRYRVLSKNEIERIKGGGHLAGSLLAARLGPDQSGPMDASRTCVDLGQHWRFGVLRTG
jgi:hypothetical protein